jgi:hypothetical protein
LLKIIACVGLLALQAGAITVGYSDNPCQVHITSIGFKKLKLTNYPNAVDPGPAGGSSGNNPLLQAVYTYTCQDGSTRNGLWEVRFLDLSYSQRGGDLSYQTFNYASTPQPSVTLDPVNHTVTFAGKWANHSNPYAFTVPEMTDFPKANPYLGWAGLSSSHLEKDMVQYWRAPAEPENALAAMPKYDPSQVTVSFTNVKGLIPAFPFKSDADDASSNLPRAFMTLSYNGPTGSKTPSGVPALYFAKVFLFPGQGDTDLKNNPLVVPDAFDPFNDRSAWTIYSDKRYSALLHGYEPKQTYYNQQNTSSPRALGYDVYFIDFSQGGGNMLINAALYLKFVEWMHSQTRNPMIVGGPSMGGQVSRLAMLYSMPENNLANGPGVVGKDLAPRVKGYISIDSPHQGASLGGDLQSIVYSLSINKDLNNLLGFVNPITGQKNDAIEQWDQLCVPAAHQMLYGHFYPDAGGFSTAHDHFQKYLHDLASAGPLGDPRGYRKDMAKAAIAYSNFFRPMAPWQPTVAGDFGELAGGLKGSAFYYTAPFKAGGPAYGAGYWDLAPGSTGDWYFNNYKLKSPPFVYPYSMTSSGSLTSTADPSREMFQGTFIPIVSALDLPKATFDPMFPPTTNEVELAKRGPFDAVYYMHDRYNSYNSFKDVNSNDSKTVNDLRYQHLIFDPQLMNAVMEGLRAIEDKYAAKVTSWPGALNAKFPEIPLAGGEGWNTVSLAIPDWSLPDPGGFDAATVNVPLFPAAAADGEAKLFQGDFNGDGFYDLLMVHGKKRGNFNVALSNAWPGMTEQEGDPGNLKMSAASKIIVADFNHDGKDDILATGMPEQQDRIYVGIAAGKNGFIPITTVSSAFTKAAKMPGVKVVSADLNGDGKLDLALVCGAGATTIPVAFGNGDGTFQQPLNKKAPNFVGVAYKKGAVPLVGNFSSTALKTVAVVTGNTLTLATLGSLGFICPTTSFSAAASNDPNRIVNMGALISDPRAKVISADFDRDGYTDIAVLGIPGRTDIPVAFFGPGGTFRITDYDSPNFAELAAEPLVRISVLDADEDFMADLVLTGPDGYWYGLPAALSNGDGTFRFVWKPTPNSFAKLSSAPGVKSPTSTLSAP